MDEQTFESIVVEALDELPAEFAELLENIEVIVEDRARPSHRRALGMKPWQKGTLYGLYQGVPLTERNQGYGMLNPYSGELTSPDTITIFRLPLVRDFPDPAALRAQIRRTVLHEIAHFFGIDDDRLRELDAY